jgi:hypothetical protein
LIAGFSVVTAPAVDAGLSGNTITVNKSVTGAPPGTTFAVTLSCVTSPTPGTPETHTIHFDASGTPTDTHIFTIGAGHDCTVTETANGGASTVAYQCEFTFGPTDPNHTLGSCSGGATGNTVHFGDVIGDSATVTVVNTFIATTTTTTTTTTAPPVEAAPAFTG